jgi:hypothetical protein
MMKLATAKMLPAAELAGCPKLDLYPSTITGTMCVQPPSCKNGKSAGEFDFCALLCDLIRRRVFEVADICDNAEIALLANCFTSSLMLALP